MIHVVDFEKTAFSIPFRGVLDPSGPRISAESGRATRSLAPGKPCWPPMSTWPLFSHPTPHASNSVRLEICYGQRFMVVDLRAGCQYGQRTAKLTVWLGGGLRRDWGWGRHVEAQNDHDSAQHKTPRPVQQSTGRCLGEHGN